MITERASLDLRIPKGAPEGHTLHFSGVGSHLVGREAGDIEVRLRSMYHAHVPKPRPAGAWRHLVWMVPHSGWRNGSGWSDLSRDNVSGLHEQAQCILPSLPL